VALPNAGGWYDQHPELIRQFEILFAEKNKMQKQEMDEQKTKSKRSRGGRR
jgi:hypothetical protein